jgi:hypothetical protein
MSIGYRIDEDQGVAFVLWDGVVTAAEWLAHIRQMIADPRWPPARALHLTDLRSARLDASIDAAVLREAAALFGSHKGIEGLKAAIVAGHSFEQARIFEDVIAQHQALVFATNSLNPACAWLGIDAGHAEQTLASMRPPRGNRP